LAAAAIGVKIYNPADKANTAVPRLETASEYSSNSVSSIYCATNFNPIPSIRLP
jgi:hypothetical protein